VDIDIRIIRTENIRDDERALVHELFETSYRKANHPYLDKALASLSFLALATRDGTPVGFALGDAVRTAVPRMPEPQVVVLAGLSCINGDYRRQGLFSRLAGLAMTQNGLWNLGARALVCGRTAHPASFRTMKQFPTFIPRYGVALSEWQREVGLCVAELYHVKIDPETFVVIGSGTPIGYPRLEIDVTPEEWRLFEAVDRDRGDSLLGMAWAPEAPEGWH